MRQNRRQANELRPIKITPHVSKHAEGSCLIEYGDTHVMCTGTLETNVPKFLVGEDKGWVTAEYSMLPRSTDSRIRRDKALTGGRSQEISRLIARSLRAAVDLEGLGERSIIVDCDVIQADGGTRTAAITGGFVALALVLKKMKDHGFVDKIPLRTYLAAVSVGLKDNKALLDLDYKEDSVLSTDMNFVMNEQSEFIELQGTAESHPFSAAQLDQMIGLAQKGCATLFEHQSEVLGDFFPLKRGAHA